MKESSLKGKLRRLGSTPKAIAAELKRRGIKGTGSCASCPIANFLASSVKGIKFVNVGSYSVNIQVGDSSQFFVTLPKACKDFIRSYDSGSFRFLRAETFEQAKACNPLL